MNRLLIIALLSLIPMRGSAQAANPQNTFSSAVSANNPSLWLSFNDATTSFLDSASGQAIGPFAMEGTVPSTLTGAVSAGYVVVIGVPASVTTTVNKISLEFYTAPTAGSYTLVVVSGTAPSLTIASSFTVTVAATTAVQTLTAPTNFASFTLTAGQRLGYWTPSTGTALAFSSTGNGAFYYTAASSSLPSGAQTYTESNLNYTLALSADGTATPAAPTPRQPGFDNTNNANYSAEFAYNQWAAAPNFTLGNGMEWDTPWTMMIHINKFNWDHTGTYMLASRGDLNSTGVNNVWWQVFVQRNSGNADASQLCFYRQSPAPYIQLGGSAAFVSANEICTATVTDAMPNGFNYNIVIENNGAGNSGSTSGIWINGVAQTLTSYQNSALGFGGITAVVTSGGTGYTSGPTIAASGGGPYCTVAGITTISGGAVTGVSVTGAYGCSSAPTIVLTGGGGTGAVIIATGYAQTMESPIQPLVIGGSVNDGVYYGPGGTDTSQNPLYIDEFAIFPGNLSFGQITNIFYQTKFYQGLLYPGLTSNPPLVILNNYGCGPDLTGDQTTAMVIGAAQAGLIKLIGVDNDDLSANGTNSVAWYRQMLDQAGMANVPVSVGASSPAPTNGGCPAANLTAYNANTPQNPSSYESASTMFRTLFAEYPTTPIYVLMTQTSNGYNSFQLSPADGISSLTGLQLQQQNYNNGGWVNGFEGNFATTPSFYMSLLNNIGSNPIYFEGGSPVNSGPGILVSRTSLDPMYQAMHALGTDSDNGWTNQNLAQLLSPYFLGGVLITASGGTGYAGNTQFTSVGGGPYCNVAGIMVSSSGVPSGFQTTWGVTPGTVYDGIGHGCTPLSFTAAGSGTNLTVTAVTCCTIGPVNLTPALITLGDTIVGAGVPTGTTIVSQTSGTTGGPGVYVTSQATTATPASPLTREPTIVLTAPTGTGVTFSVLMDTHPTTYEGSGTAQYAAWPNRWAYTNTFAAFQNSLIDPITTGTPRTY